jgi:DNA-binding CsgD family transcriptional regulator
MCRSPCRRARLAISRSLPSRRTGASAADGGAGRNLSESDGHQTCDHGPSPRAPLRAQLKPRPVGFSRPRTRVIAAIAEGLSTKDIAVRFHVSPKAVESRRIRLMDRLDIHDVAGLVRYAIRMGICRWKSEGKLIIYCRRMFRFCQTCQNPRAVRGLLYERGLWVPPL